MRKNFLLLLFSFLFFSAQLLFAQNNGAIKGTVTDNITKEPIAGATIYDANDITQGTVSDVNGQYELKLKTGAHQIVCSFIGMKPDTFAVIIDTSPISTHHFFLKPNAMQLQTMVVSAGRYEQALEEITVSMEVLKPSLIENKNSANIKTALEQAPGLNILDGEPQIRGGSGFSFGVGSRVAILIDGLPALAGDAGRPEWNFIPVENVEQIEIIKGASSVTYGSSALSGSINIRTAYAKEEPVTKVNISSGVYDAPNVDGHKWYKNLSNFAQDSSENNSAKWWKGVANFSNFSFVHAQKWKQLDYVIGGMGIYDHGFIGPPSYHQNLGKGNDNISEKEVGERTGRFNFNLRYRSNKMEGLSYGINGNIMKSTNNFSLVWDNDTSGIYRAFPKTMTLQNQTILYADPFINYYSHNGFVHSLRTRYFYTKNALTNSQSNETNSVYSEYQFIKQLKFIKDLNLTGGLVMNQTYSHAALYNNGLSPNNHVKNYAAYTQLDKKMWKVLNITVGFREEYYQLNSERAITKPIFRSGLNLKLSPATWLRSSYGQGFRFPTITEKFIKTRTGGLDIFPNPQLQPETSWNAEVGLKQGFKIFNFTGFVDAAAFYQHYSNTIEFTYGAWNKQIDQFGDPVYATGFKFLNTGETRVKGLEFSMGGEGKVADHLKIEIIGGYTYVLPQALHPHFVYAIDSNPYPMSYGSTSTDTTDNILKYRFKQIAKADVQITYKLISIGGSWRYFSTMQNIDKAFYLLEPSLHYGLKDYRTKNNKGITVFDLRIGIDITKKMKLAFVVNNLFNKSYSLRPLKIESPRTYALQLSVKV